MTLVSLQVLALFRVRALFQVLALSRVFVLFQVFAALQMLVLLSVLALLQVLVLLQVVDSLQVLRSSLLLPETEQPRGSMKTRIGGADLSLLRQGNLRDCGHYSHSDNYIYVGRYWERGPWDHFHFDCS